MGPLARRLLIDYPARAFDAWVFLYRALLLFLLLATMGSVTAMLVLAAFGIRWGW